MVRTSTLLLAAAVAAVASAQCTDIDFQEASDNGVGQGQDPSVFFNRNYGVSFFNGYGLVGGEIVGDPGNWNVPDACWGIHRRTDPLRVTFPDSVPRFDFVVGHDFGYNAWTTNPVEALLNGVVVETIAVNIPQNPGGPATTQFHTVQFTQVANEFRFAFSTTGNNGAFLALDNLQLCGGVTPPPPATTASLDCTELVLANAGPAAQCAGTAPGASCAVTCAAGFAPVGGDAQCSATTGNWDSTPTCEPRCTLPSSDWLETEFAPGLHAGLSGFTTGTPDVFRFVFDVHRKYRNVTATSTDGVITAAAVSITEHLSNLIQPINDPCWDAWAVDYNWGDLVQYCASHDENDVFTVFTCKIVIHGKEDLSAIRQTDLERDVISTLVAQVKFPKRVSATSVTLSAFSPPNVLAAIVRQEVRVTVSDLTDLTAQIDLFTSAQWPFKLLNPVSVSNPADIATVSFTNAVQCGDANLDDALDNNPPDSAACNQVWTLDLNPLNGAAGAPCELDGDYQVKFEAQCQDSFNAQTDCPLTQDDQGQILNEFVVNLVIDSEYFCPRLVDTVDLVAEMNPYKDAAFTVPATNFIVGQTLYLQFIASSDKSTITNTDVNKLQLSGCGLGALDIYSNGAWATAPAEAAAIAAASTINNGPADTAGAAGEIWLSVNVASLTAQVPADGSCDFDISVVADVKFLGNSLLLQAGVSSPTNNGAQPVSAKFSTALKTSEDAEASSAVCAAAPLAALAGIATAWL